MPHIVDGHSPIITFRHAHSCMNVYWYRFIIQIQLVVILVDELDFTLRLTRKSIMNALVSPWIMDPILTISP